MKRFFLTVCSIVSITTPNIANGESFIASVLEKAPSSNVNACYVYNPYIGTTLEGESLKVNSDKFEITEDNKLILKGDVELDFPEGLLKAGKARLDKGNGLITFSGQGNIFLDDFYFGAESGTFNKEDKYIELTNGQAYLNQRGLILNFDKLTGSPEDKMIINNVFMTSCADSEKGWGLKAQEITLDSNTERGLAKNVSIQAMGKTFVKLPYIPFAISEERMSGFLEPSISYSSDGLDFMIPYYKVLSDKSDITIAPRNIANRGSGIEANFRLAHGLKNNLRNLDLLFFNKDDEFSKQGGGDGTSRWAFKITDTFNLESSKVYIDWSKASDSLVLRDIPGDITNIGEQRKQNLNQSLLVSSKFNNLTIDVGRQGYQALNPILTNGYSRSPFINLNYSKNINGLFFNQLINISKFNSDLSHGYFGYKGSDSYYSRVIEDPIEGSRIYSDLSLLKDIHMNGMNIKAEIGVKSISYNLTDQSEKASNVNIPNFLIDISSIFIKKVDSSTSVIEPRLVIGYSAYKEQSNNPVFDSDELSIDNNLFGNDRFSGMDRVGDQKFYTLSINYKRFNSSLEKLEFIISKKFYLEDRKTWLSSIDTDSNFMKEDSRQEAPIIAMSKWMPNKNTDLSAYAGYLTDRNKTSMAGINLTHKVKELGSFGIAKRYRRISGDFNVPLDYSEIYANINISERFKFIARLKKDNETNTNIESLVGFEYENCCFAFRLTGSDKNLSKYEINKARIYYPNLADAWDNIIKIENKSRINFEFELKGFNASYKKMNKLLNNSLFNY